VGVQLHYNITFLNGGSHLPADETGLPTVYFCTLLGTAAFGAFVGNLLRQQYKVRGYATSGIRHMGVCANERWGGVYGGTGGGAGASDRAAACGGGGGTDVVAHVRAAAPHSVHFQRQGAALEAHLLRARLCRAGVSFV
jgi:hypothetical protein